MCWILFKVLPTNTTKLLTTKDIGTMILPKFSEGERGRKGVNVILQDHTISKWQSWDLNSGLAVFISAKLDVLTASHCLLRFS